MVIIFENLDDAGLEKGWKSAYYKKKGKKEDTSWSDFHFPERSSDKGSNDVQESKVISSYQCDLSRPDHIEPACSFVCFSYDWVTSHVDRQEFSKVFAPPQMAFS